MAKKLVKCPRCRKENNREEAVLIPHGAVNKYYCATCAEEHKTELYEQEHPKCEKCGARHKPHELVKVGTNLLCQRCFEKEEVAIQAPKATTSSQGHVKCTTCGIQVPKAEVNKVSNKSYCPKCYVERKKEADLFKTINEYIETHQGRENYKPLIVNSQIKRFREEHGMTLNGIYMTLKYYVELKEKELGREGIGIIPYYYDEARAFYKHRGEITIHALSTDKKQWIIPDVVRTEIQEHKPRLKRPMINMEDIDVD